MFSRAFSLALVLAATSVSAGCDRYYTVENGDVCDSISAAQTVSTYQLASANPDQIDSQCSNLQPGQQICLATSGFDCAVVVKVQIGDTCSSIVTTAGISIKMLTYNNPQINDDCTNLYDGEVLCVNGTQSVLPYNAGLAVNINWGANKAQPSTTSSTTVAMNPVATYHNAVEALAVGLNFDILPYCDEI